MPYIKQHPALAHRPVLRRRGMSGMGDFTDADQCSTIPMGDPYRKPGNYCATPDGGITTFNSDGSTYRQPGYTVDPDPAHPAGTGPGGSASSGSGGGAFDAFLKALIPTAVPQPGIIMAPSSGMSTGTMVALAGGALVLVLIISRR